MIALLNQHDEILLASQLFHFAHLVKLEQGRLEFRPEDSATPDLAQNLARTLKAITNDHWMVVISNDAGQPTLSEVKDAEIRKELENIAKLPMIDNILKTFPDAELTQILNKNEIDTIQ